MNARAVLVRTCPGCGVRIRPGMYACGHDWRRLPPDLRTDILRAWGRRQRGVDGADSEHETAKTAADVWLAGHPA